MSVMSFAHLKNKNTQKEAIPAPHQSIQSVVGTKGQVMSFAHLRAKKQPLGETPVIEEKKEVKKKLFVIPPVSRTARLQATNYCRGCGRFLPATEKEKEINPTAYGRCLRSGEVDSDTEAEVWRVISQQATVSRCYYFLKETKSESK